MDLSDLETEYKKKLEFAEKRFLINFKSNQKNSEENYKIETKKIRAWYYEELKKTIKNKVKIKKETKKKEIFRSFKFKRTNIELSKIKRLKLKLSSFIFRISIKNKNIFDIIYYPFIAYFFKKIKSEIRLFYKSVKIIILRIKKYLKNKLNKTQNNIKNLIRIISQLLTKILKIVKRKKEKNNPNSDQNKDKPVQSS